MALTDTIQCDGVTTQFTLTRAVTTKESLSLTIASGDDAGTVVSGSDYSFSPVNSVAQSCTITWANAVNYGTVGTPVDVTVAIYHNPGSDPADTLLYSYDSASAMRPEMVGRDLEHIIDLIKMVIGGADLATTSLGDQEDDIAALDVRLDTAEADINTAQADILVLDGRLDTAESEINTAQADIITAQATADGAVAVNVAQTSAIASLQDQITSDVGLPTPVASGQAEAIDSASPIQVLAVDTLGALGYIDLLAQVKNGPITDTGGYFTTDTVNAALQQLGAAGGTGPVVWVAGGFFTLEDQGGTDPAAAATQLNDPAANTTPIRTGNMDGGTAAHATNWIVMSDTNANNRVVVFLPTGLTGAGYVASDFELTLQACVAAATGEIRMITVATDWSIDTTLVAAADGSAFYISAGTAKDAAITIKRVRTI